MKQAKKAKMNNGSERKIINGGMASKINGINNGEISVAIIISAMSAKSVAWRSKAISEKQIIEI
jgi:hypothetical protein